MRQESEHGNKLLMERQFETIFNMSLSLICIADIETATFIKVNPSFKRVLGYEEEELLSKPFLDFIHPEDVQKTIDVIVNELKKGSKVINFQNRYRCRDGSYKCLDWTSHPIPEKGISYAIAYDITEQKKNLQALEESEKNLRTIIDLVPHFIFAKDADGRFILANKAVADNFNLSPKELIGKTDADVNPEIKEVEHFVDDDMKVINEGKPLFIPEEKITGQDGEERLLQTTKIPFELSGHKQKAILGVSVDITEMKLYEKELVFQSMLLDNISDFITAADMNGVITYVNKASSRALGKSSEELIGRHVEVFGENTEKGAAQKEIVAKAVRDGSWQGEVVNIDKYGNEIILDTRVETITDKDGNPVGLVGISTDITDKKRIERELKDSNEEYAALNEEYLTTNEELLGANVKLNKTNRILQDSQMKLRAILDSSLITFVMFDTERKILAYNKPYEEIMMKLFHRKVEEGMQFDEFIDPSLFGEFMNDFKKARAGHYISKEQKFFVNRVHIYFQTNLNPVFDEKGEVFAVCMNSTDITGRKISEQQVKEHKEKLELALSSAGMSIWELEVRSGKVRFYGEFESLYGIPIGDFSGDFNDLLMIMHPDDREKAENLFQSFETGRREYTFSYRVPMTGAGEKWLLSTGRLVKGHEESKTRILGTTIDISERIRFETELIAAKQKAEESDRLKSAFLANLSHEIRTPMNSIIGFGNMLKEPDLSESEKEEFIDIINNSSRQLLSLIDDVIDISKIESGMFELNNSVFNAAKLINEAVAELKPQAKNAGLSLESSYDKKMSGLQIEADPARVKQVLYNFIGNALKYTEEGTVTAGFILKNDSVEFFIKDTGIGIDKENQTIIFERFRQVENRLSRVHGGTGLGLAISKALVEKMGGKIGVESKPGAGSRFYFSLPFNDDITVPEVSEEKRSTNNNQVNDFSLDGTLILVAEDELSNYLLIERIFRNYNTELIWAKNGEEAVRLFKDNPDIDLIILDIKMPVKNGFEALKEIRAVDSDVPVIAQTAYAMANDEERALSAGCNDYISKPIDVQLFLEKIRNLLK